MMSASRFIYASISCVKHLIHVSIGFYNHNHEMKTTVPAMFIILPVLFPAAFVYNHVTLKEYTVSKDKIRTLQSTWQKFVYTVCMYKISFQRKNLQKEKRMRAGCQGESSWFLFRKLCSFQHTGNWKEILLALFWEVHLLVSTSTADLLISEQTC